MWYFFSRISMAQRKGGRKPTISFQLKTLLSKKAVALLMITRNRMHTACVGTLSRAFAGWHRQTLLRDTDTVTVGGETGNRSVVTSCQSANGHIDLRKSFEHRKIKPNFPPKHALRVAGTSPFWVNMHCSKTDHIEVLKSLSLAYYGVATVSMIDKITGLFCRI